MYNFTFSSQEYASTCVLIFVCCARARSLGVVGRVPLSSGGLSTKTLRFEPGADDAESKHNFLVARQRCLAIMATIEAAAALT